MPGRQRVATREFVPTGYMPEGRLRTFTWHNRTQDQSNPVGSDYLEHADAYGNNNRDLFYDTGASLPGNAQNLGLTANGVAGAGTVGGWVPTISARSDGGGATSSARARWQSQIANPDRYRNHPVDRDRSVNTYIPAAKLGKFQEPTPRGGWGLGPIKKTQNPFAFDPKDIDESSLHTVPFYTSTMKKKLFPANSNPELREMTECRPNVQQGNTAQVLAVTDASYAAIPGYTGYIRGKTAEDVFGTTYMVGNQRANMALDKRRKPSEGEFRQTTADFRVKNPKGSWIDQALPSWHQSRHGITHQEREPYGNGTDFRAQLRIAEQAKKDQALARYNSANTVLWTFAGPRPEDERPHHNWRKSVQGYMGHRPRWQEEKDFDEKNKLATDKTYYCPMTTSYPQFSYPGVDHLKKATPRAVNNMQAPFGRGGDFTNPVGSESARAAFAG